MIAIARSELAALQYLNRGARPENWLIDMSLAENFRLTEPLDLQIRTDISTQQIASTIARRAST